MKKRKYLLAQQFMRLFNGELLLLRRQLVADFCCDSDPERNWAFLEAWRYAVHEELHRISRLEDVAESKGGPVCTECLECPKDESEVMGCEKCRGARRQLNNRLPGTS
jgi:hypothetical protein